MKLLLFFLLVINSGCATLKYKDVKLRKMKIVDRSIYRELKDVSSKNNERLLYVSIETTANLSREKIEDSSLGGKAFFCDQTEDKALFLGPIGGIYWKQINLATGHGSVHDKLNTLKTKVYYFFLRTKSDQYLLKSSDIPYDNKVAKLGTPFDLEKKPRDICFRLETGSYRKFGNYSNTITIKKDQIISAFKKAN